MSGVWWSRAQGSREWNDKAVKWRSKCLWETERKPLLWWEGVRRVSAQGLLTQAPQPHSRLNRTSLGQSLPLRCDCGLGRGADHCLRSRVTPRSLGPGTREGRAGGVPVTRGPSPQDTPGQLCLFSEASCPPPKWAGSRGRSPSLSSWPGPRAGGKILRLIPKVPQPLSMASLVS